MKKLKLVLLFGLFFNLIFVSCGNDSQRNSSSSSQKVEKTSINGVYSGSTSISGLKLEATVTINGNRWSATSSFGPGDTEYQIGIVSGNDLYDESGYVRIGYVQGNTVKINGYPTMTK